MTYIKKIFSLANNYVIARLCHKPSTALFWYLPEPATINHVNDLQLYQQPSIAAPFYFIDYRKKLTYPLVNDAGIIVLPYADPIGQQVNPEAAFQYALGLHDTFYRTQARDVKKKFLDYANYFRQVQSTEGLWEYHFDWFAAKAPWSSALAQARGASVMMRAWMHTQQDAYRLAALNALKKFTLPIEQGGFLHSFAPANCSYFEEYPSMPTGVINGFMAALMSIWELQYWLKEEWLVQLWQQGITSLEKMLPYYSTGWWSLYDRDADTPVANVNSPRYHFLEMQYLRVLSYLSASATIATEYQTRCRQYNNLFLRNKALMQKLLRKIVYK